MQHIVCDSGQRGNLGCTSEFIVEGKLFSRFCGQGGRRKAKIIGTIIDQSLCQHCEIDNVIGTKVEWSGIMDEKYYGHPYLQL